MCRVSQFYFALNQNLKKYLTRIKRSGPIKESKSLSLSKMKEAIVEDILPVIKSPGIIELEAVLTAIKNNNKKQVHQETLQTLYANFSLLNGCRSKKTTLMMASLTLYCKP